ncbi:hypothetical protein DFH09DRAFT_839189, partial [Mycena vulgaris]
MTKGEITPLIISQMEEACINYFAAKDTAAAKQVATILSCFRDPRVTNWIRSDHKRLTALEFDAFMEDFRKKFLRADWQITTRTQILASRMKESETFDEWATSVQSLHSLIANT